MGSQRTMKSRVSLAGCSVVRKDCSSCGHGLHNAEGNARYDAEGTLDDDCVTEPSLPTVYTSTDCPHYCSWCVQIQRNCSLSCCTGSTSSWKLRQRLLLSTYDPNHPYLPPPSTVVRRSHPLWLPVSTTIGSSPSLASASIGPSSRLRSTHRCLLRKRGFSSELLASFALRDRFKVLLQYVPFCLGFHASVLKLIGALNSSFDKSAVIGFKI